MKRNTNANTRDQQLLKSIRDAITLIEARLNDKDIRASTGDLLGLIKAEAEIVSKKPSHTTVTWIDPEKLSTLDRELLHLYDPSENIEYEKEPLTL